VTATLRPLDRDEIAGLAKLVESWYADDMHGNGGIPIDVARRKAASDIAELVADETAVALAVEVDGEQVGHLWVGERNVPTGRVLWIYDVFVDEERRGRGLGREAMLLAEEEARRRGLPRIVLNVFGANDVARRLYASLGYNEVAVVMGKDLK